MNRLQSVLDGVFSGRVSRSLSAEEVEAAVELVRLGSDEGVVALVEGFGPLLRKSVRRYAAVLSSDDAGAAVVLGVHRAALDCDGSGAGSPQSFTAIVSACVGVALRDASVEATAVHVPSRTLDRFFGVLRRAGGDAELAAAIAPEFAMTRETFYAVAAAVRCGSLDVESVAASAERVAAPADGLSALETRELVHAAFRVVDDLESDVIRAAYGFSDFRAKPDAEIAGDFGMSRTVVQRVRARGLGKMREALAVDVEE